MERSGAGEAGGAHHWHELVRAERLVEHGVVTLRGAHPDGVPGLDDLAPGGPARQEAVHDLRVRRVGRVHGVEPAIGPHRREAAEDLVTRDLPPSVDAGGGGYGEQQGHVVAGFAVECGKDLTLGGLLEDPAAGVVAEPGQVGGDTCPIAVHVDRQRGSRCHVGEAPHELRVAIEHQPAPSELGWNGRQQVAGAPQLVEILVTEPVVAVIEHGALVETSQHVLAQEVGDHGRGGHWSSAFR